MDDQKSQNDDKLNIKSFFESLFPIFSSTDKKEEKEQVKIQETKPE